MTNNKIATKKIWICNEVVKKNQNKGKSERVSNF